MEEIRARRSLPQAPNIILERTSILERRVSVQAGPSNGTNERLALSTAELALAGRLLGLKVAAVRPAEGRALGAVGASEVGPFGEGAGVAALVAVVGGEVGDEELGDGGLGHGLRGGAEVVGVGDGGFGGDGGQLQDEVFVFGLSVPGFLGVDGVPFWRYVSGLVC